MTKTRMGKARVGKTSKTGGLNIREATASYEHWMRRCTTVISSDLRSKHEQMKESPFLFLRGTFYRWAQQWSSICSDLCDAPEVLAVGDLHVNSFGTWRDVEGRLCWGVDDFDEAFRLPYTNDLVRLAASMKIVIDAEGLSIKVKAGCDAILEGYVRSLKAGGRPLVLAEREQKLGKLGIDSFKPPTDFWDKLNQLPPVRQELAPDVRRALEKTLPDPQMEYRVVRRQAGLGSLGQQRFVAIGEWRGGYVAREAKAVLPSACVWMTGEVGHGQSNYEDAISSAVRSPDPFQVIQGSWLIRRLSPDSNPIDIQTLPKHSDEQMILQAMGAEAANVHLGTKRQATRVLKDLSKRKANWLRDSANHMAAAVEKDWKRYKKC
ncbi:DUF2252 family protein [Tunturiibacter lichenicola]|uniref:DUF2252 family protein n=1 Tax=Tunturiibacter lichenicola TaxID=2051959 RepID=UPI0028C49B51|nr:DUF2252 family protein [Edaphobacter lichenicola]